MKPVAASAEARVNYDLIFGPRWEDVLLRSNRHGLEPGVSGMHVDLRIPLSKAVAPGRYIYIVDESGMMWLGPIDESVKHSSLVPAGSLVRAAGHLAIKPGGVVHANSSSGHYMKDLPVLKSEEPAWRRALTKTIEAAKLKPGTLDPGSSLIRD